jgi:hypothetical protein
MHDKPACNLIHRQILSGICPSCEIRIEQGALSAKPNGPSQVEWNWTAIEADLRGGDVECRSLTVWNLSDLATHLERVLPLLAIAMPEGNSEDRSMAVFACGRLGRDLSTEQIPWLEMQRDEPDLALAARTVLLAKYAASRGKADRAARATHIYWFIQHHPDSAVAGSSDAYLFKHQEAVAYEAARQLWMQQCVAHRTNAAVIGNAANFFLLNDSVLAEKLYLQAQQLDPANPQWHEKLAHLYTLSARHGPEEQRSSKARKSLVELEMAEQLRSDHSGLPPGDETGYAQAIMQMHTLPNRARAAFEAGEFVFARQFAERCLALAAGTEQPADCRSDGNAIHYSHLVLGLVALREGDLESAKSHLLESGKTTGSPNLGSFGPNMSLAKQLLECGERETVLAYLELCGRFWERGSDRLAEWKDQVAMGETPAFGANLIY